MNKKGADKIMAVYWFAIFFIVAASVAYMAIIFYGKPYDVREIETNLLVNFVVDCMVDTGKYNGNSLSSCGINFEVEDFRDWKEKGQYYVEMSVYDFKTSDVVVEFQKIGNPNLKDNCKTKEGENFPVCLERSVYVVDEENNQFLIKIFASVRKTEKNVK